MRGGDEESTRKRKRPEKKSPAARLQNSHVRRRELLLRFATFGNYPNLDLRGHLAVQFGGDAELSQLLDRLPPPHLAPAPQVVDVFSQYDFHEVFLSH